MDYNRNNNYEMSYMNPATGQPAHPGAGSQTNYGFQYNYNPPGGNPPKYEDVMGNTGNDSHKNAYPSAPVTLQPSNLEGNTSYEYFPPSTTNRESYAEPRMCDTSYAYPMPSPHPSQTQPQPQIITVPPQKKQKSNCGRLFVYILIRFIAAVIIGGIIRGIVYAAYG